MPRHWRLRVQRFFICRRRLRRNGGRCRGQLLRNTIQDVAAAAAAAAAQSVNERRDLVEGSESRTSGLGKGSAKKDPPGWPCSERAAQSVPASKTTVIVTARLMERRSTCRKTEITGQKNQQSGYHAEFSAFRHQAVSKKKTSPNLESVAWLTWRVLYGKPESPKIWDFATWNAGISHVFYTYFTRVLHLKYTWTFNTCNACNSNVFHMCFTHTLHVFNMWNTPKLSIWKHMYCKCISHVFHKHFAYFTCILHVKYAWTFNMWNRCVFHTYFTYISHVFYTSFTHISHVKYGRTFNMWNMCISHVLYTYFTCILHVKCAWTFNMGIMCISHVFYVYFTHTIPQVFELVGQLRLFEGFSDTSSYWLRSVWVQPFRSVRVLPPTVPTRWGFSYFYPLFFFFFFSKIKI